MSTLFDLTNEFEALFQLATSDEEQAEQAFIDTLEGMKYELAEKAEGYCHVINRLQMESDKAKSLSDALLHKKAVRDNNIRRMKEFMLKAMNAAQLKKIDTGTYTIAVSKNGGKQPMVIDGEVPDNFKRIIYEDDKELIRKHLEDGEKLKFAHLAARGEHISIK